MDFTQALEQISPSIVTVNARRGYALSGVVWLDQVVITTNRAVEHDDHIQITLADQSTHKAALAGRDPRTDLAVLKVEEKFSTANWKNAQNLMVGQWLLRVGRPDSLQATHGILSYLGPSWRTAWGGRIDHLIDTDADTFSGFSGGAVITANGEVIGINTAALKRSGDAIIPTSTVKRVATSILEHGHVRRGYLGLSTQPVNLPTGLEQKTGLMIVSVEPSSPAAKAGLALGDTILHFDRKPIEHHSELMGRLEDVTIGQQVTLKILRGGQQHDLTVDVGER